VPDVNEKNNTVILTPNFESTTNKLRVFWTTGTVMRCVSGTREESLGKLDRSQLEILLAGIRVTATAPAGGSTIAALLIGGLAGFGGLGGGTHGGLGSSSSSSLKSASTAMAGMADMAGSSSSVSTITASAKASKKKASSSKTKKPKKKTEKEKLLSRLTKKSESMTIEEMQTCIDDIDKEQKKLRDSKAFWKKAIAAAEAKGGAGASATASADVNVHVTVSGYGGFHAPGKAAKQRKKPSACLY
jgi:hypothetical protein